MRDDDDRVLLLELHGQLLDLRRGDRIERACGLVHEQHLGLDRECAGDAQSLLLAAGETERVFAQAVFHLVPDGRAAQRLFDDLVELRAVFDAVRARAVGDVVVDAHRERVRFLKDHADLAPQLVDIRAGGKNVLLAVAHIARDLHAGDEVVHAVERFEKRGLAAAGRPDERRDALFRNVHADIVQRLMVSVPEIQTLNRHNITHRLLFLLKYLSTSMAAPLMSSVRSIKMAAMAKATSNCPCSLA